MKISEFSVNNTLLVHVISLLIVLGGLIGLSHLNREAFPNFSLDVVSVQTYYPGSTPKEVEKLITIPIEEELKSLDDIDEIKSYSAEGISMITVIIEEDAENKDRVINEIQRAVDRVTDLPIDLEDRPLVTELTTKNRPIISLSISGEADEYKLQAHARNLEKKILDIPDIAKVIRNGWREKEIWIEVNPQTMRQEYLSLNEVISALNEQNVSIPGGNYYEGRQEFLIRTSGEFETAKEIEEVIVRSNTSGRALKVKDIAAVKDDFEEEKIISKTNGKRTINLTILKKERGDTITLVEELERMSLRYEKEYGFNVDIEGFNDMSYYIKRRLNVLVANGTIGMALVMISLFIFLSFRIAIAACLGFPIAILSTFALMNVFGISINLLSMFGMIMVIGMLVDEEIVVSENIYRYLEKGLPLKEATLKGTTEVSRAVIATVCTTIAAFIPLFLMSGTMGKFVSNIPLVVILTLVSSLTVALFILPSHIIDISKKKFDDDDHHKEKEFFLKLQAKYLSSLKVVLKRKYLFGLSMVGLLLVSILFAATQMYFVLFPQNGIEQFYIRAKGELGTALEITEKNFKSLEKLVSQLPKEEVDNFTTDIGIISQEGNDSMTERGSHLGQITVYLHPETNRERSADEIIDSLRDKLKSNKDFKQILFEKARHGPPVGKAISVRIKGDDLEKLKSIAKEITAFTKTLEGALDVEDDTEQIIDIVLVDVDNSRATQAGLSVERIARVVRTAFQGTIATTIKNTEEEINVVVQLPIQSRYDIKALESLLIQNKEGKLIPLNQVAQIKKDKTLQIIQHDDGRRAMTVSGNVDENKSSAGAIASQIGEKFSNLGTRYPGYMLKFGGEQEKNKESLDSLLKAFAFSIGLIFVILVAMFQSLVFPIVILITIPFSLIGVVIAFALHDMPLSFMAILGMVGLTGVTANSGIIIIDFIQKSRMNNGDISESIMEGAKLRFRPVILTSLTTALGVIPAAYGIGGLDPFIQPMALTLNYGLVFGAGLSLYFIPALVAISDDLKRKVRSFF